MHSPRLFRGSSGPALVGVVGEGLGHDLREVAGEVLGEVHADGERTLEQRRVEGEILSVEYLAVALQQ